MKLKITVDGKVYEVDVDVFEPEPLGPAYVPPVGTVRVPAAAPPLPSPRAGAPTPVADEGKVCRSPIAGTVAKVPIQVGQLIKVNDVLMVLEAMKMETVITAPITGKVAKINANVGDFVQGGQVLVDFE
ncbi:MAG TPA: biotin/lipoyl-containing protein [Gemmataceae bacterium]|nr:biotin/lipoyl-containing protein [Gemmataceae bacterium]